MEHIEILKRVDHTLLTQTATWAEVQVLCDEGIAYGTAAKSGRLYRPFPASW